ncbi:hypothetical protein GCM10027346_41940 [Hymenobacter seoulensis]
MATDASRNVYLTGDFYGTVRFGTTTLTAPNNYYRAFVAKISPTGTWLWAVAAYSLTGSVTSATVAVAPSGTVYVGGDLQGAAVFGTLPPLAYSAGVDPYVAQLDPGTGAWRSAVRAGGSGSVYTTALTLDAQGSAYLTGYFSRRATFGATTFVSPNFFENTFVAKLSAEGVWEWAAHGLETGHGRGYALATDPAGNVYLGGMFAGTARFGSTQLGSVGGDDNFVAKLDAQGHWQWAATGGGNSNDFVAALVADGAGHVTLSATSISRTAAFGATVLTNPSTESFAYLAQVNANTGAWNWALLAPRQLAQSLHLDTRGNVLTAGSVVGPYTFTGTTGQLPMTAAGGRAFVGQLSPAGVWLALNDLRSDEAVRRFALDNAGTASLMGSFTGPTAVFGPSTLPSSGYYSSFYLAKVHHLVLGARSPTSLPTLELFPNPAASETIVKTDGQRPATLTVTNALGQVVLTKEVPKAELQTSLQTQGFARGLYLVQVTSTAGTTTRRLVLD